MGTWTRRRCHVGKRRAVQRVASEQQPIRCLSTARHSNFSRCSSTGDSNYWFCSTVINTNTRRLSTTGTPTPTRVIPRPSPFSTATELPTGTPYPTRTPPIPTPLATNTPGTPQPFSTVNVKITGMTDLRQISGAYGAWSPDGQYYAYTKATGSVSTRDGRGGWQLNDLWIVQSDATNNHLLVSNATNPAWDQDSKTLYYFSFEKRDLDKGLNNLDLHEIGVDGQGQRLIYSGIAVNEHPIQVLPQGNLAFLKDRQQITIVNRASGAVVTPFPNLNFSDTSTYEGVRFAPKGDRVAYVVKRQLWLANADGSATVKLAEPADGVWNVKWSPDGRYLAYGSNNTIWIVNRDGSSQRKLISVDQMPGPYDLRNVGFGVDDWSPDNNVIFLGFSPTLRIPASTYVVDSNGGVPKLLTKYYFYGLSPNGDRAVLTLDLDAPPAKNLFIASVAH